MGANAEPPGGQAGPGANGLPGCARPISRRVKRRVGGRLAQGAHPPLQRPQRGGLTAARLAPGQMDQDPITFRGVKFAIDPRREAAPEMAHGWPPWASGAPVRGRGSGTLA